MTIQTGMRTDIPAFYLKWFLNRIKVGVRVVVAVAAILVLLFSLQIEALPYSYLAGWIGMFVAELPLFFLESMIKALADDYQKQTPNAEIKVKATDSSRGIIAAISGECDLTINFGELLSIKNTNVQKIEKR